MSNAIKPTSWVGKTYIFACFFDDFFEVTTFMRRPFLFGAAVVCGGGPVPMICFFPAMMVKV